MASTITKTKTIRMRNEVSDWVGENGRAILEGVYALTEMGAVKFEEGILKISEKQKGTVCTPPKQDRSSDSFARIAELEREIAEKDHLIAEFAEKPQNKGIKWQISDETMSDLEQMAKLTGGTLEGLLEDFRVKLNSGEIEIRDGKIEAACPFNWQDMVEVCKNAGIEPDRAVDKFIQMMYRGMV